MSVTQATGSQKPSFATAATATCRMNCMSKSCAPRASQPDFQGHVTFHILCEHVIHVILTIATSFDCHLICYYHARPPVV